MVAGRREKSADWWWRNLAYDSYLFEWLLPLEPGLPTYVTLHDRGAPRDSVRSNWAMVPTRKKRSSNLWTKLVKRQDSRTEAIDYVAATYAAASEEAFRAAAVRSRHEDSAPPLVPASIPSRSGTIPAEPAAHRQLSH